MIFNKIQKEFYKDGFEKRIDNKTSMVVVVSPVFLPCSVKNVKYIDNQETIAVYRVTVV